MKRRGASAGAEPVTPDQGTPPCPVGESTCEWLEELARLRDEVAELREQARIDPLTGLHNYRHFTHSLEVELERSYRTNRPTGLIMLDLDHFKAINDRHGHEVGNSVLRHAAKLIGRGVRRLDIICRYGGEEFAVILPSTGLGESLAVARRLRSLIETHPLRQGEAEITVTASLGVDVSRPGLDLEIAALVERADRLLYEAKVAGRNRVCHADDVEPERGVSPEERGELLGDED